MTRQSLSRWTFTFFALAVVLLAGCETGFVQDAARTSLASFVTNIFSTAVTETIGP